MKKTESMKLFEELKAFQPTQTEQERETARQKAIAENRQKYDELTEEGNALIKGLSVGEVVFSDFKGRAEAERIQRERIVLNNQLRTLKSMPVQDDEYVAVCEELDAVKEKRMETENRYAQALTEYSSAKGSVPFAMYQSLEKECYELDAERQSLLKKESELKTQKGNYVRKTDALYDAYLSAKTAEIKKHLEEGLTELLAFMQSAIEERNEAEEITLARKGIAGNPRFAIMLPYQGDLFTKIVADLEGALKDANEL